MERMPEKTIQLCQTDLPHFELAKCPVCGEPSEQIMTKELRSLFDVFKFEPEIKVGELYPAICRCVHERESEERERERIRKETKERVERFRQRGLADKQCQQMTFKADGGYNPKVNKIARKYVDNFEEFFVRNDGLLFTGDVGTGKTFYAACIVNALIDKGFFALLTTLSRIINVDHDDYHRTMRAIEEAALVCFDDVGSERDTSFAYERAFEAIDIRVRAQKPIVVTTNLTPSELGSVVDKRLKRIYDRILGVCLPVVVEGPSIRAAEQRKKIDDARGILLG